MSAITREPRNETVTIGTDAAGSTTIEKGRETTGSFQMPTGAGTTSVQVYGQVDTDEDWQIPKDADGVAIPAITVAAEGIYCLPDTVYKLPRFKLVAATGTATTGVKLWLTS